MKKYTNKILIITAIVLVLGMIIGYTIQFQTDYRSGKITYKPFTPDSTNVISMEDLEAYSDSVMTEQTPSPQDETSYEKETETSNH